MSSPSPTYATVDDARNPLSRRSRFGWFLLTFYMLWLVWVGMLLRYPGLNDGMIRATVRLIIWVGSALVFLQIEKRRPVLSYLRLTENVGRGIFWGMVAAAIHLGPLSFYRAHYAGTHLHLPSDLATWLNPVLTAPLAEEILFRGTIFQHLHERIGMPKGMVISALLFALAHFPYWFFSGAKTGLSLATALAGIFVYGLVFAGLFRATGSLWTPLVYHTLNNLTSV